MSERKIYMEITDDTTRYAVVEGSNASGYAVTFFDGSDEVGDEAELVNGLHDAVDLAWAWCEWGQRPGVLVVVPSRAAELEEARS